MTHYKNIFYTLLASIAAFTGCAEKDFDLPKGNPDELPKATYTISQLKNDFLFNASPANLISDNSGNSDWNNGKGVVSYNVYNIASAEDVIINAVVVSTDAGGNIYKKLVLRDLTDGSSIDVSVDAGSISGVYPEGQRISIRCNDLQIGLYAEMPTIGMTYHNIDNKERWEPGRMPYPIFGKQATNIGLPDTLLAQPVEMTIPQIIAGGQESYSKLVILRNVEFGNAKEVNYTTVFEPVADSTVIFADKDVTYPTTRMLRDENGNTINISTSPYAKFQGDYIPGSGTYYDVIAIVGWYRNKVRYAGEWQLVIQTLGDIRKAANPPAVAKTILNAPFGSDEGGFSTVSVNGAQEWGLTEKYGMVVSGFANGKSNANEDWLISPAMNLKTVSSANLTFSHAINKGDLNKVKSNHTLWITDKYTGGRINPAEWEEVKITNYPSGDNWDFVSSGDIALPAEYIGKENVRIAFKYLCSDTESASWEIKSVLVKGY